LISLAAGIVASAQDPINVDPAHYRLVFENAHMRVLEYRDKPGDKAPMHSHPAYMTYVTGPARTKITLRDGRSILDEAKGSAFACNPPTRHATENVGPTDVHELIVEFKGSDNPCSGMIREASVRDRLIGTWRLVSDVAFRSEGPPEPEYGPHPLGYLMYDKTGHMCVTLANPNPPHWADPTKPTDRERALTHKTMEAYCGRYEVREEEGQVIHRPELAEWPHYIGSDQVRNFRLEGDRLILSLEETPPNGERHRYEITWERVAKEMQ